MKACLHSWRHGFIEAAELSVSAFLLQHATDLNTAEDIKDRFTYYLSNADDEESCIFQWRDVNSITGDTKVRQSESILLF
jgi:acetylglutamate synthase